jgi:hypothetical protein
MKEVTILLCDSSSKALFIQLIIRTFQLVFSAETVFFSHNKSANSVCSRLISTTERGLRLQSSMHQVLNYFISSLYGIT